MSRPIFKKSSLLAVFSCALCSVLLSFTAARSEMVEIPKGKVRLGCEMGTDPGCYSQGGVVRVSDVDTFRIDKMEVSVADYERCVGEGKCSPIPNFLPGCEYANGDNDAQPRNCVTLSEAEAYCAYSGGFLPSEAQWVRAARGEDNRAFPWGNDAADCKRAVMAEKGFASGCGKQSAQAVGGRPSGASPFGTLDMAGNLAEWVSDVYSPGYESRVIVEGVPVKREIFTAKGGGFDSSAEQLNINSSRGLSGGFRNPAVGFRCAAKP